MDRLTATETPELVDRTGQEGFKEVRCHNIILLNAVNNQLLLVNLLGHRWVLLFDFCI